MISRLSIRTAIATGVAAAFMIPAACLAAYAAPSADTSAATSTLSAAQLGTAAKPASSPTVDPRNAAWEKSVDAAFAKNPTDYVGIEKASRAAGGSALKWTIPGANLQDVDSNTAAKAYAAAVAASPEPLPLTSSQSSASQSAPITTASLPVDMFTVAGYSSWIQASDQFVFSGTWNFRDNYVGSGGPEDVSSLTFKNSCWEDAGTVFYIYDYTGKDNTRTGYLAWGAINKTSIVQMRDQTSGFVLSNDHGVHRQYVKKGGDKQCNIVPVGQFNFQHNQGGGKVQSVSAGWGFLTVSFSGGTPDKLTKSTSSFSA